jgi:regulatory protein
MAAEPAKKKRTPQEALERSKKFCAFQERSHLEVRYKLLEYGLRGNDLEEVMAKLIEGNFLNEERFAIAFARGKFRLKNWGRKKIEQELKRKGVSGYLTGKALKELPEPDYRQTLNELLRKKAISLKDPNPFTRKQKLSSFLIRKGYEPQQVFEAVKEYYRAGE